MLTSPILNPNTIVDIYSFNTAYVKEKHESPMMYDQAIIAVSGCATAPPPQNPAYRFELQLTN